jgi:sugar phosphate permease
MNRIFYGWWVLAGVFIAYAASNGIILNTLPLIYPNLIEEFGWSNEEVTRPATIFLLVTAVLSPLGGSLLDRYPPKRLMIVGLVLITMALALLPMISSSTELTMVYLIFSVGLALGGLIASMLVITRWFVRHRGVAVGLLLMASSFGGALFPMIVKDTLITSGWREAMLIIAVIGGVMMIAPLIIIVRNHPNDMGLNPDGDTDAPTEPSSAGVTAPTGANVTLQEAFKMPTFYLLAFATGTLWFCILGVLQHQGIYLGRELKVDPAVIPDVFIVFFWSAIVGKVIFGWFSDHYDKIVIMLAAVFNLGLGLLVLRLSNADSLTSIYLYAIIFGCGYSGAFTMIQLAIAEYFSGASYGKILGVFTMVDTIAGSAGVLTLGLMSDSMGSYAPAFNMMMVLCTIAFLCVVWLKRINDQNKLATQAT